MIFSRKHNFIFIHVPRTAGTSIGTALLLASNEPMLYRMGHRPFLGAGQRFGLPDSKSFGFIRNPFERDLSLFMLYQTMAKTAPSSEPTKAIRDEFVAYLGQWVPGNIIRQSAHYYLDGVSRVGRFENLDAEFSDICRWIGLPNVPPLARENGRSHAPYQEYYDERSRDLVLRMRSVDFETYHYSTSLR